MRPGILLICDPDSARARSRVAGLIEALEPSDPSRVRAAGGDGWAAAVMAAPGSDPECGGGFHSDGRDLLCWSGEMFLPPEWTSGQHGNSGGNDTAATLLRRLQSLDVNVLADVDGAFCGAWYDGTQRRWVVFNDRLGLLPVFHGSEDERLVVASQARLVWQASDRPLNVSGEGVVDLLRCENMVGDHTLIEGVHWLEGASVLEYEEQTRSTRCYRYWDLRHRPDDQIDQAEAMEAYLAAFEQTLRRHTQCTSPLMLGISGGLDSRMLLAMCGEIGRWPDCFTAGWSFSDDVRFGRRLARAAGVPHTVVLLSEEGLADALEKAVMATDGLHGMGHMAPASAMRDHLRAHAGSVLLEGYLQGVLGGAYVPDDADVAGDQPAHARAWARYRLHGGGDPDAIDRLLRPDLATETRQAWEARIDDTFRRAPGTDPLERAEYVMAARRSGRIDVLGTALLREDVRVRCPACDKAMLDWHASTPVRLRRGKHLFAEIIRRRYPRLARIQRTASSGMPVARDRWLREYCWQREKLHRLWTSLRHPWTRRYGTGGEAIRSWTLASLEHAGALDVIMKSDARILEWVNADELSKLWQCRERDPLGARPLLNLATAEIMIRHLERLPTGLVPGQSDSVQFTPLMAPAEDQAR